MAGPRRPQDRVGLGEVPRKFAEALPTLMRPAPVPAVNALGGWEGEGGHPAAAVAAPPAKPSQATLRLGTQDCVLHHGQVVIPALKTCSNTSHPSLIISAALIAT